MAFELLYLPEPLLGFRHDQKMQDPRDGLSLFGPLEVARPEGIRWGLIGTRRPVRSCFDFPRCPGKRSD